MRFSIRIMRVAPVAIVASLGFLASGLPAAETKTLEAPAHEGIPTNEIPKELLDNLSDFKEIDFYEKFFPQVRADKPLELEGGISKDYFFPTLYKDVTVSVAMFACNYTAASRLLPAGLKPVRIEPTKAMVILSSYHYGAVYGIAPYNEIGISIAVVPPGNLNVPLLPLKRESVYVVSMPVTARENEIRGHHYWGLPKVVKKIDLRPEGGDYITTVSTQVGNEYQPYLEFRVSRTGKVEVKENDPSHLYTMLNGKLRRSTSRTHGTFVVKGPLRLLTQELKAVAIKGDSPEAKVLKTLLIDPRPLETRFGTGIESTFALPEPME